jgi:hypothetical protein
MEVLELLELLFTLLDEDDGLFLYLLLLVFMLILCDDSMTLCFSSSEAYC